MLDVLGTISRAGKLDLNLPIAGIRGEEGIDFTSVSLLGGMLLILCLHFSFALP